MSTVEVTVVVPTRNRASMLGQALRSVAAQHEVDLEAGVVDDGSTDATAALVSSMGDRRLRLIRHQRPRGVSVARNRGVAEARGRWVAFLDDDDLWAPDKLSRQLAAAERDGRGWAVTGAVSVDEGLRVLAGEPPPAPERIVADLDRYNSVPAKMLLEVCNLANEEDRRLVQTRAWRQKVSEAVVKGLLAYYGEEERGAGPAVKTAK